MRSALLDHVVTTGVVMERDGTGRGSRSAVGHREGGNESPVGRVGRWWQKVGSGFAYAGESEARPGRRQKAEMNAKHPRTVRGNAVQDGC